MTTAIFRPPRRFVDALERASALDAAGDALGASVRGLVGPGAVKDVLSGTAVGHPVHPPLTDVVIGSVVGATMLDVLAPQDPEASERLLAVGLLAAVPTALTGATDWADSERADPRVRRVGFVHAAANVAALVLAGGSLAARRRGTLGLGRALSALATGALSAGGFLGGHLSYTRGVGVNQTAHDHGPSEWTAAAASARLGENAAVVVVAGTTPILLVRHAHGIHAVHDRCAHCGALLRGSDLDGHTITCPLHGSQFDIRDGSVLRGPSPADQPVFEVREDDGQVMVRLSSS